MSSQLKVNSIRDTSNNEALTISSGNVSFNNTISAGTIGSSVTGFTGIKNADQWRLTANSDAGTGFLTSNFEQNDSSDFGYIGSAMTESSGVFSFPVTGIWLIEAIGQFHATSVAITYAGLHIYTSTNAGSGDTYTGRTITYANMDDSNYYQCSVSSHLFDVTNVTTHKVKFYCEKSSSTARTQGSTTLNLTHMTFLRLGDT